MQSQRNTCPAGISSDGRTLVTASAYTPYLDVWRIQSTASTSNSSSNSAKNKAAATAAVTSATGVTGAPPAATSVTHANAGVSIGAYLHTYTCPFF